MIVFDLRCPGGHVFEAWFASSDVYEAQRGDGLIACPLCQSTDIAKAVMAPRVGAKGGVADDRADDAPPSPERVKQALRALAAAQARALEGSRWVGDRFAEEARAIHHGAGAREAVHGRATLAEAKSLIEEGVAVAPLPLPVRQPDTLN